MLLITLYLSAFICVLVGTFYGLVLFNTTSNALSKKRSMSEDFIGVIFPILKPLALLNKRLPIQRFRKKYEHIRIQLSDPFKLTADEYLGLRELFAIVMGVLFILAVGGGLVWFFIGCIAGFSMPQIKLNALMEKREKLISRNLPTFIDFVSLVMQSGIDFNMAISKTVMYFHGNPVSDLFSEYLEKTRMGISREKALSSMLGASDQDEFNFLLTSLIQTNKLGSSVRSTLLVQAEQIRLKRLRTAEKAAALAPGKMLLPLMLFIFPALLLMAVGPVILKLMTEF